MRSPLRLGLNLAAGAGGLALVALGVLWLGDRTHRWEEPRWEPGRFLLLRREPAVQPAPADIWLVAVNPRCPHCVATLARVHAVCSRNMAPARLITLIVDTPRRPNSRVVRALASPEVWWDRRQIWRRRWGHRLYGERIEFDRSGRYLRTVAAETAHGPPGGPGPRDGIAPAEEGRKPS